MLERIWKTGEELGICTIQDALDYLTLINEKYGHLDTVQMVINKGNINFFYSKPKNN